MATMPEVVQEENQRLKDELASMHIKLRYEVETNKSLVAQAQSMNASLAPEVKNSQYTRAYETFEQYDSGYGYLGTPTDSRERSADFSNIDRVLTILYEVQSVFEESISVSSVSQVQAATSPLGHLQTVSKELQARSADFAKFLSSYVNMLTKKRIIDIRANTEQSLQPYFAEKSDLRQVTSKLASLYEIGLFVEQADMSTMPSDLHIAVLSVINGLIHLLQVQQKEKGLI